MTLRRGIAANGDSEDVNTWSGIPYYLLQAGRTNHFLQSGLDLRVAGMKWQRRAWHAGCILRGEKPRGFQYCAAFLRRFGRKAVEECHRLELQEIVSHYQLLPARYLLEHSIRTAYYIDTTLQDLFTTHGMLEWLNSDVAREAIEAERIGYQAASRVVTMSRWVQSSVQEIYGVPRDRIQTVMPGANLPEDVVQHRLSEKGHTITPDQFTPERPFRLGFTGKDWKRKGLPRLVAAVEILNRAGIPSEVVVIGSLPEEYGNHRNVRSAGFIDKSREVVRFIETLESCDLGCAPSHEEPMGIAPLEYLRLGIPVLCTAAGGLTDVCEAAGPASILVGKDATPEEIAFELEVVARDRDVRSRMLIAAWNRKEYFSWERTADELQRLWAT